MQGQQFTAHKHGWLVWGRQKLDLPLASIERWTFDLGAKDAACCRWS